ncbi:Hypothetical_protein [Hexamita inflata]|uniref:Hypothetical_protein n=1 Tax=Hexamita inflata TaxID=28002 RepID=A0AA86UTD7_9EUKA|nr:Hypothetical protein HINF_LOCUS51631 [Hexamita inflata]
MEDYYQADEVNVSCNDKDFSVVSDDETITVTCPNTNNLIVIQEEYPEEPIVQAQEVQRVVNRQRKLFTLEKKIFGVKISQNQSQPKMKWKTKSDARYKPKSTRFASYRPSAYFLKKARGSISAQGWWSAFEVMQQLNQKKDITRNLRLYYQIKRIMFNILLK